jgi:hypothetical protein
MLLDAPRQPRKMRREEIIARDYFLHRGFESVAYEPNGNRPPDLLLDGCIAVEVRRLNQYDDGHAVEDLEHRLIPRLIKTFNNHGDQSHQASSFVGVQYSRPMKVDKILMKKVMAVLDTHSSDMSASKTYKVTERLELKIFPSSHRLKHQFNFGGSFDIGHGGFVVGNIYDSLKIIVKEKLRKTGPYRHEYKHWWLALVDYIGYGLNDYDLNQLKEAIDFDLHFEKLIFISPIDSADGIEL